ncbi:GNAT family N-acetyltransferase [Dactylosporangium sp. AC04546]|uniref:GNAT family N-acetyltransferase n=1 Tax=Dactylosporangium sp. AC04546 TaxID=2862460 RepID=UPI001EDE42BE|nr:GNAT family N-acetyltransferase [Dactylosporangium sp. AC04546]WVK89388.1 GNAT family N-acetyltransferase [Dactylosporangium sp. AC04546]
MDVRPLNGDDWQLKRDLRLAALKDSPSAFASTYAREEHRSEHEWRDWPHPGAYFCAFGDDGDPLGIAGSWVSTAEPDVTHLISMWVTPGARGRRVAAALVDAVAGWAGEYGSAVVELEVAAGNDAAMTAYLRCGFEVTDREPFTVGGTVLVRRLPGL